MSNTSGPGVWEIYGEAETTVLQPDSVEQYPKYIIDMIDTCVRLGGRYGRSKNALSNMKGHWFEMLCKTVFEKELGKNNVTMHVGDGRNHKIKELVGFEHVTWITYPDAIVVDENRLKAAVSIKWGMRHDRMYEPLYAALAMNDVLSKSERKINFYLLTNDDSPARICMMLEAPMLDNVYHLVPPTIRPNNDYQKNLLRRLKGLDDLLRELKLFV